VDAAAEIGRSGTSPEKVPRTTGCTHAQEKKYTFIGKTIRCSGRLFLRASALKAPLQHRNRPLGLKPHFYLRIDYLIDSRPDMPRRFRAEKSRQASCNQFRAVRVEKRTNLTFFLLAFMKRLSQIGDGVPPRTA
jgi:hypothetical protein